MEEQAPVLQLYIAGLAASAFSSAAASLPAISLGEACEWLQGITVRLSEEAETNDVPGQLQQQVISAWKGLDFLRTQLAGLLLDLTRCHEVLDMSELAACLQLMVQLAHLQLETNMVRGQVSCLVFFYWPWQVAVFGKSLHSDLKLV